MPSVVHQLVLTLADSKGKGKDEADMEVEERAVTAAEVHVISAAKGAKSKVCNSSAYCGELWIDASLSGEWEIRTTEGATFVSYSSVLRPTAVTVTHSRRAQHLFFEDCAERER